MVRAIGAAATTGVRTPPRAPVCPRGWRIGPPDFIGIGAQRAGTTRWFELLCAHPEIEVSPAGKELHFFDRFFATDASASELAEYRCYFPRAPRARLKTGEWTPLYMATPSTPQLIARAAPEARLLVLLRDPVERFLSGIEHNAKLARENRVPLSQLAPMEAYMRGMYHGQLRAVERFVERSRVLVLQYERCTLEPRHELRRTYEFLGLEHVDFVPEQIDVRRNATRSEKPQISDELRVAYVEAYRDDVERLASDYPEIDLRIWPNFAEFLR